MATVNLGRARSPFITRRRLFALAGAAFALALFALIASDLLHNDNRLSAQNPNRVAGVFRADNTRGYTSAAQLIETVEPSVVQVVSDRGVGGGFVLHNSGLIATCYHCIAEARSAGVVFADGVREPIAGVIKTWPEADIAILSIHTSKSLVSLPLAEEPSTKGQRFVAFGSPIGLAFSTCEGSVSASRTVEDVKGVSPEFCRVPPTLSPKTSLVQVFAPLMPGNSGGPIVDFSGYVLGICSFVLDWHGRAYSFCISASEIRKLNVHPDDKVTPLCGDSGPQFFMPQPWAGSASGGRNGEE